MHKNYNEAKEYLSQLQALIKDVKGVEIVLAVPFPFLNLVGAACQGTNMKVAAQNMHFEEEGAFTGEVSAKMIKDFAQ